MENLDYEIDVAWYGRAIEQLSLDENWRFVQTATTICAHIQLGTWA